MRWKILQGDVREALQRVPSESIQCCVTSPPYWGLRDYGHGDQIGLEETPDEYVAHMVEVFREVRRVLRDDGTLWLNLGDSYAGSGKGAWARTDVQKEVYVPKPGGAEASIPKVPAGLKPKDLIGIPWRVALALQADGWYLRSAIVWAKPNPMPESVRDRPTSSYEHVFLLAKGERYFYDADAIAEPLTTDPSENYPARAQITGRGTQGAADARGNDRDKSGGFPPRKRSGNKARKLADGRDGHRPADHLGSGVPWEDDGSGTRNARNVWTIATKPFAGAHFAVFPPELAEKCVLAGSAEGDPVLDPFAGSGTTGAVAMRLGRKFLGIELNPEYVAMAEGRVREAEDFYAPLLDLRASVNGESLPEDFPHRKYVEGMTKAEIVEAFVSGEIEDVPGVGEVRRGQMLEAVRGWV